MSRLIIVLLTLGALAVCSSVSAQKEPPAPKPESYLCPDAFGGQALDCFLNAVEHLYTMCRQVKSIEIIEFGYEKSDEGVNGAKSAYCVDKHKPTMNRLYNAALHQTRNNRGATDELRMLHDHWLTALHDLKWKKGESDEQYKSRIAKPYDTFRERASAVRTALASPDKGKPVAEAKSADKSKSTAAAKSGDKGKAAATNKPKAAN